MKNKFIISVLTIIGCTSLILTSCNSEPIVGPQGAAGEKGDKGDNGLNGKDGNSVLTGHGVPSLDDGKNGDSYIDLDTWNYYIKNENEWVEFGNIKGGQGDIGEAGVSIVSTYIDDNGDLIVTFSNNEIVNAGHIKDTDVYTVKFYCDDLLVDTQLVKHGEKIDLPNLEDFTVKHWYLDKDFEYEWLWYGCVVTENMSLYGKFTPVIKSLSFGNTANISIDEYGYGETQIGDKGINVSKADETTDYLTSLQDRGILFNKGEIGYISEIKLNISEEGFSSAKIYYGNNPLSFEHSSDLVSGNNTIDLSGAEYFTIQNSGNNPININSLLINYSVKTRLSDESLPTVVINTKNSQAVLSRITYVNCNVSTIGADKDVNDLSGKIKVRGNTTAYSVKKPYRIKLDKKNSLFGYEKAKNWVLLADYLDASNMHNYTALKFTKMIRGEDSFGVDPLHVNVILNGENVGIYLFGEHIEAKEGRLNIEQDEIWTKNFDEINFYIERDLSTAQDSTEIEDETYFMVNLEDHTPAQYAFALKYPEKEDFEETLEDGSTNEHLEEFNSYVSNLKTYMTNICTQFIEYSKDSSLFQSLASIVDMQSLAMFAVIDQVFAERDHAQKSFKMYRDDTGKLKFGPNWDYDACAYGLPIIWTDQGGYFVENPFKVGSKTFYGTFFGEEWGNILWGDSLNGLPLFKEVWDNISYEMIDDFINAQYLEMKQISNLTMCDCEKWMNNHYYSVFDNQQYYWKWISTQLPYLKGYYS